MYKKITVLAPTLLSVLLLSGCSSSGLRYFYENRDANLVEESYDAVERMQEKIAYKIPKNSLIVVSTLLNVDNMNQTSSFGRIVSDQIASGFNNLGYQVIGMEIPVDLFVMKEGGRFHLPDDVKEMLRHYHASTLVGGVYAPGKHHSYVSLRMVDLISKNIIASTDFPIPMGPDAKMLMKPKELGSEGARSPGGEQQEVVTEQVINPPEQIPLSEMELQQSIDQQNSNAASRQAIVPDATVEKSLNK